ncbi:hypothetical protein LXT21_33190 [Myxococcus sp. K38C18041901]|uniref:hypothetical protein n=1 Tax=Myxococcus guangdongensis TaxID=2906760 RepID=UPI0020A7499F|nr:hypothetical protein [Myxococcus guangdongensis]MCP3063641.1 hypothetical protein [Myxococcus guangdongensis]
MRSQHIFVAIVLLSASARAEALKPFQKEAKASFEKAISSALKTANTACGTRLKVKTNFNWFDLKDWEGRGYEDSCKEMILGLASMCETPERKKALAKKVTGLACLFTWDISQLALYAAAAPEHPDDKKAVAHEASSHNVSFSKGWLTYQIHKGDKGVTEDTWVVLGDVLRVDSR